MKMGQIIFLKNFLRSQTRSELLPFRLNLKSWSSYYLATQSIPCVGGVVTATRMVITRLGRRCIEARILGGEFNGLEV